MAKRKPKAPGKLKSVAPESVVEAKEEAQMGLFEGETHSTAPVGVTQEAPSSKFCSGCGVPSAAVDKFCSSCGHNLQGNIINILFEPTSFTASYPSGMDDPNEIWGLIAPKINVAKVDFNVASNGPTFSITCGLGSPEEDNNE